MKKKKHDKTVRTGMLLLLSLLPAHTTCLPSSPRLTKASEKSGQAGWEGPGKQGRQGRLRQGAGKWRGGEAGAGRGTGGGAGRAGRQAAGGGRRAVAARQWRRGGDG